MIIKTDKQHRIAKELFLDYTTGQEISKRLYGTDKKIGYVSDFISLLKKKGYIDEENKLKQKKNKKGKIYSQKILKYRLNLKFFYDYVNKNVKLQDRLKPIEKRLIGIIFEDPLYRKEACKYRFLHKGILDIMNKVCFDKRGIIEFFILFTLMSKNKKLGDYGNLLSFFRVGYSNLENEKKVQIKRKFERMNYDLKSPKSRNFKEKNNEDDFKKKTFNIIGNPFSYIYDKLFNKKEFETSCNGIIVEDKNGFYKIRDDISRKMEYLQKVEKDTNK